MAGKPRFPLADPPARWPFLDERNLAVITLHRIFDEHAPAPVTHVVHESDGSWQFLDGGEVSQADASVVGLKTMVRRDSTLLEVATLPRGWYAVRRSPDDQWWPAPSGQSVQEYYSGLEQPQEPD